MIYDGALTALTTSEPCCRLDDQETQPTTLSMLDRGRTNDKAQFACIDGWTYNGEPKRRPLGALLTLNRGTASRTSRHAGRASAWKWRAARRLRYISNGSSALDRADQRANPVYGLGNGSHSAWQWPAQKIASGLPCSVRIGACIAQAASKNTEPHRPTLATGHRRKAAHSITPSPRPQLAAGAALFAFLTFSSANKATLAS